MKRFVFITALLALLLSACGAPAVPTIDPAQVQASAVAAASTMIAQTQAAIPPTPVPTDTPQATPTPLDTPTAFVLPTSVLASPTTSSSSGDPCNAPLPADVPGTKTIIVIQNKSSGQANVSLYLEKTKFGQCGYRGYQLPKGNSVTITDLTYGAYDLLVWINGSKPKTLRGGPYWITSSLKWTLVIGDTNIQFLIP